MLRYVTKAAYWALLDKGIMHGIPATPKWHLKDIQDAVAYSHLYDKSGLDIAEIGAGHSRLLMSLAQNNRCSAIDEYKGAGGGPSARPKLENVNFIDCAVGHSKDKIKDESYDVIFSVSVIEHVSNSSLPGFFSDCRRMLRPGGLMIHLFDAYAEDPDGDNELLWKRIQYYLEPFTSGLFSPLDSVFASKQDAAFRTSLASNPDNIMREWNVSAPGLLEKRKRAQSCTIEMAGLRID